MLLVDARRVIAGAEKVAEALNSCAVKARPRHDSTTWSSWVSLNRLCS
jgi:hypothetical protein